MASEDMIVAALIIDFRNAFMSVALHDDELPYNCCEVKQGVSRIKGAPCTKANPNLASSPCGAF